MSSSTLTTASAVWLADQIRSGAVSSREVVEAHVARADEVDAEINAIAVRLFDDARRAADSADARRREGRQLGPLHGVPISVKECFALAGTPATAGVQTLAGERSAGNAPLVQALLDAGAIIIAKTNLGQLIWTYDADNPLYGRTRNPWNTERSPGGSSGGEAALVAACGSPLGLGTDSGGSVRLPAHFCGVHGLKPTAGRLTTVGTVDDAIFGGNEGIVNAAGPFARSVGDLDAAMRILAPASARFDSRVPPLPWPPLRDPEVAGLRIGIADSDADDVAPAIRRALGEAVFALEARGVEVVPFTPPSLDEAARIADVLFTATHPRLEALLDGGPTASAVARALEAGRKAPAPTLGAHFDATDRRNRYRAEFAAAVAAQRIDVLLTPPLSLPAPRHDDAMSMPAAFKRWQYVFNVIGWPAGVLAASFVSSDDVEPGSDLASASDVGLPVGVQVAAMPWRDDLVLTVMAALEQDLRPSAEHPLLGARAEPR